ncbi:MAG: hypothetical protein VX378_09170 [Pseudomonadota bacterium]|nr:hypothetical protein [Pseudomonadota bacterium]MEE3071258.1 hypothetical protein [Pseudomonadota bacterium]
MALFDEQTALVRALFSAALSGSHAGTAEDAWQGFLSELCAVTRAESALLRVERAGNMIFSARQGTSPELPSDSVLRMRFDRVYGQEDLTSAALEGPTRLMKARIDGVTSVVVMVSRPVHARDFRSVEGQYLSGLAPFLGQATEGYLAALRTQTLARFDAEAGAQLGVGWILFDTAGKMLALSDFAAEWEAMQGLRLSERRRFEPSDPAIAAAFRGAFSRAVADTGTQTLRISDAPLTEMVLRPDVFHEEPVIRAVLRVAPDYAQLSDAQFATHFSLSPSEARLLARLCAGDSLKQASEVLGWTIETTRSCSKQIYARTGVSGQPALIKLVYDSAVLSCGRRGGSV